jgi:hypothetical protein
MDVASTILEQLGGGRFILMTGAKDLVGDDDSLVFKIGKNARGVNLVKIKLTPMDTYRMEFYRVKKGSAELLKALNDVYWEDLQRFFTDQTGMETKL